MKRTIFSLFMSVTIFTLFAADGYEVKYTQPKAGMHQLEFTTGDYDISSVSLQGETYSRIDFEGKIVTQKKGFAELPYLNASVMLGPQKNVFLGIIPGEYEEISLEYPLVPSRGVIYRTQDPATVPYIIDPKSVSDTWYPVDMAEITKPYIIRDIRGVSVYVYPFQYNAARQVLRVYKSITIRLGENNSAPINPLLKEPQMIVREMDGIYRSVFINYSNISRDNLTIGEYGDIHVIVTSRDEAAIAPYVQWKREKGFNVSVEVVPSGTTVNANVQTAYDNNNNILYVLLVGDWADLQCTTGGGRPMDPQVGTVVGTDDFADIAIGRFSAGSPTDVTVQVNKAINYEKTPEMGASWYQVATGIASAEGAGIGDDGESDIQHETVIYNDKLDPFTYGNFNTIFDPGATVSMVNNAVNNGTSVINYTGHGSSGSWGTTGFSTSNVSSLTNGDKLPYIISVACNNGDFDLGTCFAEAWLRKSGGGAVMFMGASISQPWAEPMRGQDYFMDILIGGYDYSAHPGQNGINTNEQRTTLGSVIFNGLTLMCVESGGSADWETAKTWNYFGDPSLQARTAAPADITASNTMIMVGIPFTTMITSEDGPVANTMVTLSQDGLFFTGITDETGNVTIEQTLNPGTAKFVVSGFNTETIYEEVSVIPPDGAYISIGSVEINDEEGNGNGLLDYGETVYLTIGLVNVGTADATGVNAEISSADIFSSITDLAAEYGTIPAGDTVYVSNGFQVMAFDSIPDMHTIMFDLAASGTSRDIWISGFAVKAHAPVIGMEGYTINDADGNNNGRLDPGETAIITITAANSGSADAFNATGTLSVVSDYITVNNSPLEYGDISAGLTGSQEFGITIDLAAPAGHAPAFVFDLAADMSISCQASFVEYVGQIPVLILDWDGNHTSPSAIELCLNNLEVGYDKMTTFPADRNLYASIFVCLGTYSDNHMLTSEEGEILAEYLDQGGNLFMEGADTWAYDPQTAVHAMFNITGTEDGTGDLTMLMGMDGSITEGMSFTYNGDNAYVDHLEAIPPAQVMFRNSSPAYNTAVSYDAGTYKTVGFSFEFGGLQDGEKNKDDLMIQILEFFNISGVWTDVKENAPELSVRVGSYPNPFRNETVIRFETQHESRVSVEIFNISGQLVNSLFEGNVDAGMHEVRWNGVGNAGSRVAEGMYFYSLQAGNEVVSGKLMLMD